MRSRRTITFASTGNKAVQTHSSKIFQQRPCPTGCTVKLGTPGGNSGLCTPVGGGTTGHADDQVRIPDYYLEWAMSIAAEAC
jgi:hypothetical protein